MFARVLLAAISLALVLFTAGCEERDADAPPDIAVRQFVDGLRGFQGDEAEAKALYQLLSAPAQRNLRERAERYGAASGKQIGPWAMLVPSRMGPRFSPQNYSSQIAGKYAMVDVIGARPGQRVQIPCVLEEGHWHVDLALPELPPLRRRPGTAD